MKYEKKLKQVIKRLRALKIDYDNGAEAEDHFWLRTDLGSMHVDEEIEKVAESILSVFGLNKKPENAITILELKNPTSYFGFSSHPTNNRKSKVLSAKISPSSIAKGFDLEIKFKNGRRFYNFSSSVRGSKQVFAFQCSAGSKWDEVEIN